MKNVCFTGHRYIQNAEKLSNDLTYIIELLIQKGTVNFFTGGAIGFDSIAAQKVIELRKNYPQIKLTLILPCYEEEQTLHWTNIQKNEFQRILLNADNVEYVSEHYFNGCMKKRNLRLVELADYCICYYNNKKSASGTGQTVRMALKKNITIINLYNQKIYPKTLF